MDELLGVPVLQRSGVFWVAPDFAVPLEALRVAVASFRGWELHPVPVRASPETVHALQCSAAHALAVTLARREAELEDLLRQPRSPAALLVRQLDALEGLRRRAALHARLLDLSVAHLAPLLEAWAGRIDAALCARIVA